MHSHFAFMKRTVVLLTTTCAASIGTFANAQEEREGFDCVFSCHPGAHGVLEGGPVYVRKSTGGGVSNFGTWNVETMEANGPTSNRIDLVFVGDGYIASEVANFEPRATAALEELFNYEPFTSYRLYFNAHRVDVISPESGVDNDPDQGISRDTALDMAFWCGGTERLLCVNVNKAWDAAMNAPDVDQIFAVANSTKYGGAGYSSNEIGTFSSDNSSSQQVAIHELGHSLGNLADEYDYGGPSDWPGGEPSAANVSIHPSAQMTSLKTKWHLWLGYNQPELGQHSTFEGANYSSFGIYRPTENSMMRALYQPFNMPSREKLIIEFQKVVNFLESFEPNSSNAPWDSTLSVSCVEPTHGLTYEWRKNGTVIPGATSSSLELSSVADLQPGDALVVIVTDMTTMVRDESARAAYMREIASWVVDEPTGSPADLNGDGEIDGGDLGILLAIFGSSGPLGDLDGSGWVDGGDIGMLLAAWTG